MRRRLTSVIALAGVAFVAAACSKAVAGTPIAGDTIVPDEPARLTVATFGGLGYEDLLQKYQSENPEIAIVHDVVEDYSAYYQKLSTQIAAGSPPDVVVIEESHLPEFAEDLEDLAKIGPQEVDPGSWLRWKYKSGVTKDGAWVGYGADIGPLAMAYRTDLFTAAGLANPNDVFQSWESYFATGQQYVQRTGKPWFDSSAYMFKAMHDQLETGFFDEDDTLVIESSPDIRTNWDQLTAAAGQSAKLDPFSPEWIDGMKTGAFATMLAPSWMLGVLESQGGPENAGKWAITEVFPNGGGNWGGSFVSVPRGTESPEAAAKLAAWLTEPEQQLELYSAAKTFPSRVEALESAELRDSTLDYFGDIKIGRLYAELADKVPDPHYKTRHDAPIQEQAIIPALEAVDRGTPPDQAWQQAVNTAKDIAAG